MKTIQISKPDNLEFELKQWLFYCEELEDLNICHWLDTTDRLLAAFKAVDCSVSLSQDRDGPIWTSTGQNTDRVFENSTPCKALLLTLVRHLGYEISYKVEL